MTGAFPPGYLSYGALPAALPKNRACSVCGKIMETTSRTQKTCEGACRRKRNLARWKRQAKRRKAQ